MIFDDAIENDNNNRTLLSWVVQYRDFKFNFLHAKFWIPSPPETKTDMYSLFYLDSTPGCGNSVSHRLDKQSLQDAPASLWYFKKSIST